MLRGIIFLFLIVSVSCRPEAEDESALSGYERPPVTVVIAAGGFASCPNQGLLDKMVRAGKTSQIYNNLWTKGIIEHLRQTTGEAPVVFSLCYTGQSNLLRNSTHSLEGRYAWNSSNLAEGAGGLKSFAVPQGEILQDTSFLSHFKAELQRYFQDKESEGREIRLYLVGHSYGGFTAIQLAHYFAKYFQGMVTIDAISMLTCQAKHMATQIYKTIFLKHPGCREAPSDLFSQDSIAEVAAQIDASQGQKWWVNIYQESFPWLHSGTIETATGNLPENRTVMRNSFANLVSRGNYHSQMAYSPKVWDAIVEAFVRER